MSTLSLGRYKRPKRDWSRIKEGLKAGAPWWAASAALGGGLYLYNKSLSPEQKRKIRERRQADKEKRKKSKAWGALKYGAGAYFGSNYGGVTAFTGYQTYKARKGSNRGLDEYWKKNPHAYNFYKHKKAKGDTKAVKNLLKKLRLKSATNPSANYFKTYGKTMAATFKNYQKHGDLKSMGAIHDFKRFADKLRVDERDFINKLMRFNVRYMPAIVLGSTALGAIYGYNKHRRRSKK